MMSCTICKQPIELVPSAKERAKKFGGKPSDYTNLFKQHAACLLAERRKQVFSLIKERTLCTL